MAAERARQVGPLGSSVVEALRAVMSTDVAKTVLDVALLLDDRERVPEEATHATSFVYGPLRKAVETYVNDATADAVIARLDPILTMAGSQIRRREDPSGIVPTEPPLPPARQVEDRVVLVSSLDRSSVHGLARQLVGFGRVRQLGNVFDLVAALETNRRMRPIVIVDCSLPAVDPVVLASMLPIDVDDITVILWGATERMVHDLEAVVPRSRGFIPCAADATHDDLAMLVRSLG